MKKYTPEQAKKMLKSGVMGITIPVDTPKSNPLRTIKNNFYGLKLNPEDIKQDTPAGVLFFNLCICFQNNNNVSEGCVGDIIWGFRQSGIPNAVTYDGFKELRKLGYMTFTDPDGVHMFGDIKEGHYYKWTNKFLNLLMDKPSSIEKITNDKLVDKRAEDL